MNVTNDQPSHDLLDGATLLLTSPPRSLLHIFQQQQQQQQPQQEQPLQHHSQRYENDPDVQRMISERYVPPTLIVRGVVSPDEVQQLFSM